MLFARQCETAISILLLCARKRQFTIDLVEVEFFVNTTRERVVQIAFHLEAHGLVERFGNKDQRIRLLRDLDTISLGEVTQLIEASLSLTESAQNWPEMSVSRRFKLKRQRMLTELRGEVAELYGAGLKPTEIGQALGVSARDVIALSPASAAEQKSSQTIIPRRAIAVLIDGPYAYRGGRTRDARLKNLAQIVSSYTRDELLAEPGIGVVAVMKVDKWLDERGLQFRSEGFAEG